MSESVIAALQEEFAIPGIVQIAAGHGGLAKISITTNVASAEIYLHGAQVTCWQPSGADEVLFVSERSRWEDGRAIRGGIPICFPWFRAKSDNAQAPAHGLVRTKAWKLDSISEDAGLVTVALSTGNDEVSARWWPHSFHITHRITVGAELKLELCVTNTGSPDSAGSMYFEEALHTYFAVGDAASVRVAGLDAVTFLDNMDGNSSKLQQGDVVYNKPTDSAYLGTAAAVELIDPVLQRRIRTAKHNSMTTVIWNPWQPGAAALADLGDNEWQQMACVEASNIMEYAVAVSPGQQHTMTAVLSLASDQE